jgi:hypothetical protein
VAIDRLTYLSVGDVVLRPARLIWLLNASFKAADVICLQICLVLLLSLVDLGRAAYNLSTIMECHSCADILDALGVVFSCHLWKLQNIEWHIFLFVCTYRFYIFLSEHLIKYCLTGWQNIQINIAGKDSILYSVNNFVYTTKIQESDFDKLQ